MEEFAAREWKEINKELRRNPAGYGLPKRVRGSALVASFNVRKLGKLRQEGGDDGRDAETMEFLARICRPFDLLAIQEVMPQTEAVIELGRLMGDDFGIVMSDTTGTFPGDPGNPERMAFIYNRKVVQRAELVTDLTFDRTEVLRRLFASRAKIETALRKHAVELERHEKGLRKSLPQIKMPEFLAFIRTPFAVAFRIGSYDFLAINAHLHYGHYMDDRRLEARALGEWIVAKVRATDGLNAVLFGDLNLDLDNPKNDLKRIIRTAREVRERGEELVRVSFPFLFPHPNPGQPLPHGSKIFRTNVLLSETFDQIGIFTQDPRLQQRLETRATGHVNKEVWGKAGEPDYGVVNFTDLFSVALHGKRYHELDAATREDLVGKFDFSVSDHLPIWLRMPLK